MWSAQGILAASLALASTPASTLHPTAVAPAPPARRRRELPAVQPGSASLRHPGRRDGAWQDVPDRGVPAGAPLPRRRLAGKPGSLSQQAMCGSGAAARCAAVRARPALRRRPVGLSARRAPRIVRGLAAPTLRPLPSNHGAAAHAARSGGWPDHRARPGCGAAEHHRLVGAGVQAVGPRAGGAVLHGAAGGARHHPQVGGSCRRGGSAAGLAP